MLVQCWLIVYDTGPTLNQHWLNVSCFVRLRSVFHFGCTSAHNNTSYQTFITMIKFVWHIVTASCWERQAREHLLSITMENSLSRTKGAFIASIRGAIIIQSEHAGLRRGQYQVIIWLIFDYLPPSLKQHLDTQWVDCLVIYWLVVDLIGRLVGQ